MKDIIKLVVSLGLVCAIGSFALSWVHSTTEQPIKDANEKALTSSLKLVLPKETVSTEPIENTIFFKAMDADGKQIAYAAQAKGKGGFGGDVTVLVGLDMNGKVLGVMVTENSETPGIGSKATDRKVEKSLWDVLAGKSKDVDFPPNSYLDSYTGHQIQDGFSFGSSSANAISSATFKSTALFSGIHAISGATRSSNAILNGVNAVGKAFHELKNN